VEDPLYVPIEEEKTSSSEEHPMNEQPTRAPTAARAYLRYLASRAHDAGIPYLPIEALCEQRVHDWIDYLRIVVTAQERATSTVATIKSGAYLLTPSLARAPDGYRPPYQDAPAAFDHEHVLDTFVTEDDHDVVYCTRCGEEW